MADLFDLITSRVVQAGRYVTSEERKLRIRELVFVLIVPLRG